MRVLVALPGLHRVNRGAEVALEEVAARVASRPDLDVTLFGMGAPRANQLYRYRQLRGIGREYFERFPRVPYLRDQFAYEELFFVPQLYWNYRPEEYDVTVTCGYPYTNWILRSKRQRACAPAHVFITQNGDWMVQAKNSEFKHFSCDALVCTNPEYYDRHWDKYRHCVLIPNGVDTARFSPGPSHRGQFGIPESAPLVLTVSALSGSKHVLDGIRAVAELSDAWMIVAGDGEQRNEVDALGRELLGNRYCRLMLPRKRMPDLYRAADVLLHMSQDEPFGNVYVEALATGLPIVAHSTLVTQWILEDQAILVDTCDRANVVVALRQALAERPSENTAARRLLAERRFSWDAIAAQYCDFFHAACLR